MAFIKMKILEKMFLRFERTGKFYHVTSIVKDESRRVNLDWSGFIWIRFGFAYSAKKSFKGSWEHG